MYFSTQNSHGPGLLQLNPWNPKQEVSDPETCLTPVPSLGLRPRGDTHAPSWLLPQHRGDFYPLGKEQAEMSLEGKMLWEQAAIYESAVAWMWLFRWAHPASCYGDRGN